MNQFKVIFNIEYRHFQNLISLKIFIVQDDQKGR